MSKLEDDRWGKIIEGRKFSPPFGSKAVIASNTYIKNNNLQQTYNIIHPNEKVKVLYLIEPNPLKVEAFAFNDLRFAVLFKDYIDYDKNFEKFFLSPLDNILKVLNIDVTKNTQELDEW